jgi:hypothetical protein
MRERFEWWHSGGGQSPKAVEKDGRGEYRLLQAATAWRVWQAAEESVHVLRSEPLSDPEIRRLWHTLMSGDPMGLDLRLARLVEQAHGIGAENTHG